MFIFFTCIKKTNQKKVQPITRRFTAGPTTSDFPVLLGDVRRQKTTLSDCKPVLCR